MTPRQPRAARPDHGDGHHHGSHNGRSDRNGRNGRSRFPHIPAQRPWLVLLVSVLEIGAITAALFGLYALLPLEGADSRDGWLRALGSGLLLLVVLAWQISGVRHADRPVLRAARALTFAVVLFMVLFASYYGALSHATAESFNHPLDRVAALYFTITVLSSVGFGDLVPVSEAARLAVSVQMVADLALLGAVIKVLFGAARARLDEQRAADLSQVDRDSGQAHEGS